MGDSDRNADRAAAGADFLEWCLSIKADSPPWSVEQSMTQLLAHESAEGFAPSLAAAARDDAEVIHELGRRPTPTAVAALRAFQAMSTIDTQRDLARINADRLVRQGLPEPPWAATIGRVRVDGCWWAHDEVDETAIVLCAFSYDGEDPHGILALIDRAIEGGLLRELTLGTDPDLLLRVLRQAGDGDDGLMVEPLDPARARQLLEDAVATTDELIEDRQYKPTPVPAAYRKMRALTLARARALSDSVAPPPALPGSVELELLKRAFLDSDAARALPAHDATSRAVDLLVAHITQQAGCHPLRLGPRRILALLGLPALAPEHLDDPDVARVLPDVADAWVSWAAAERGLSADATARLGHAARQGRDQLGSAAGEARETP
ncbi:hypothetical protein ACFY2R_23720 [Micromonospora olivasterospora]|uniref:Uncharacterized protein n=1 Tax=Micromonospora olivasterospora TaxID=1880 RepID=A0A562IGS9_MICOL|nr:hypothetical protein [Micromonospora olivasterospora]TWH69935.1 hypothetical protein JD77_04952 [Micromonospora olivasterospora]